VGSRQGGCAVRALPGRNRLKVEKREIMLEFVHGDMFDHAADIRVNTVNCVGVMGAGVALAFKQRYPDMFKDYQRDCKAGRVVPGKMHVWRPLDGDWIINFPTKRDWRDPSQYPDIEIGLDDLRDYLQAVGPVTVCLPALGCGHGGLDWARVSEMIRTKLADVGSRILVFAPADSKRVGQVAAQEPSNDELLMLRTLGINQLPAHTLDQLGGKFPIFGKGIVAENLQRWVALLPSKSPNEREWAALHSIAGEFSRQKFDAPIALVYTSRISEEIAAVFHKRGLKTVFVLPFGALTRKTIAQIADTEAENSVSLLWAAQPNAKWTRMLYAQAMELLRAGAGAVLLSDPEPDWLKGSSGSKWSSKPMTYVRYEHVSERLQDALSRIGAVAMGKRGNGEVPKLGSIISAFPQYRSAADLHSSDKKSDDNCPVGQVQTGIGSDAFTLDLLDFDDLRRREIIDLVLGCAPEQLSLNAKGLDDATIYALREWVMRASERSRTDVH
jgi:O-acetyl-ADP-ribose deacetylase (regulator of RNase III)